MEKLTPLPSLDRLPAMLKPPLPPPPPIDCARIASEIAPLVVMLVWLSTVTVLPVPPTHAFAAEREIERRAVVADAAGNAEAAIAAAAADRLRDDAFGIHARGREAGAAIGVVVDGDTHRVAARAAAAAEGETDIAAVGAERARDAEAAGAAAAADRLRDDGMGVVVGRGDAAGIFEIDGVGVAAGTARAAESECRGRAIGADRARDGETAIAAAAAIDCASTPSAP